MSGNLRDDRRKVVVFTASGDQGSSVCRYLIEDGNWEVVGISRNPDSPSSQELAKIGVKVVKGDMDDPSSYQAALEGAYGAFINADFMATYLASGMNPTIASEAEKRHALGAVDACVRAGVKHAVYTALEGLGNETMPHYVTKRQVSEHIRQVGLPTTFLHTSRYFSNMTKFGELVKRSNADPGASSGVESTSFVFELPVPDDCPLPCFAVEQIGAFVLAALNEPDKYIWKDIQACGEILTTAQIAQVVSELSGKTIDTLHLSEEAFYSDETKAKCTEELWLQYRIFYERTFNRDPAQSRQVVPDVWDCRQWALNNRDLKEMLNF
ncbi:hypothetical protein CI109_100561 [Kwoniella shandongensis]|uniref:NmrA-like domain-containing protein n=1 Tax=Kwoniella shandongensis TaxID=1734106 RepID=A0A5M6C4W7_9TREE|nr:uncharacterized protein CI109_003518 [Kwoniella shandongensis]KAA5528229.1 hypothetical protein CI109_003518 [Kwoniella shandongensis]